MRVALSARPENAEALNILGYSQLRLGQRAEALSTYASLAGRFPKSAEALYGLGNAQSANGKTAAAELTLKKALELRPDFPEAMYALVALQLGAGKVAAAGKIIREAQRRQPNTALGSAITGDVAMAEKRYGEAASAYASAYSMEKSSALLMKLHGALLAAGKAAAAEALIAEWLRDNPNDTQVRYRVADAAIRGQNFQLAAEQYRNALINEPNKLPLLHNLGWVYEKMNDPRAIEVAEAAYKIAPDNPGVLHDLSRLLIDKGDVKRAIELLEKARLESPDSPPVRYHLARAYAKNGSNALARAELQQALRGPLFPERVAAEELFRQLSRLSARGRTPAAGQRGKADAQQEEGGGQWHAGKLANRPFLESGVRLEVQGTGRSFRIGGRNRRSGAGSAVRRLARRVLIVGLLALRGSPAEL